MAKKSLISYRKLPHYKYQLLAGYGLQTHIIPGEDLALPYVALSADGRLDLSAGYAWDGASGPAIDTLTFMRGSLVHDAMYQLMRAGLLNWGHKYAADELLGQICREDGMAWIRSQWVVAAVKAFAGKRRKRI